MIRRINIRRRRKRNFVDVVFLVLLYFSLCILFSFTDFHADIVFQKKTKRKRQSKKNVFFSFKKRKEEKSNWLVYKQYNSKKREQKKQTNKRYLLFSSIYTDRTADEENNII